ncbi:MAG TPA: hypothetical protein VGD43_06315, partial [Micromonospora sp.]
VIMSRDGPRVVETNFDTAAAGHERPDDLWRIAAELFQPGPDHLAEGRPLAGLRDWFVELCDGRPRHFHWMMKDDPATRRELAPVLDFLNRDAGPARHSIHYAGDDPSGVFPDDRPGMLHRACSIFTVNRDRERFAALLHRIGTIAPECTVPSTLSVLSSKLFLAWLSDPAAWPAGLTPAQADAVDRLVPWTRAVPLLAPDELDRIRDHPGRYVLKKADSHQGVDVHFGWDVPAGRWSGLLAECRADPMTWVVQERVRPRPYELTEYTDAGVVTRRTGLSCCPYLIGGRLRGLETWLVPARPNRSMLTRMHFVPHFVRSEPAGRSWTPAG